MESGRNMQHRIGSSLHFAVAVTGITHRMGNTQTSCPTVPCFHLSPPTPLHCYPCCRDTPYIQLEICTSGIIALFGPVKARLPSLPPCKSSLAAGLCGASPRMMFIYPASPGCSPLEQCNHVHPASETHWLCSVNDSYTSHSHTQTHPTILLLLDQDFHCIL